MTSSRRGLLAGSAALLFCRVARGEEAAADDLLARIAKAREPVRTLQARFVQTRTISLMATDVRSQGALTLVRPDRLRWELDPPDAVTFWVGPEGLAYRSAHGQGRVPASTARIAEALTDLRTVLGGDLRSLRERWVVRTLRDDAAGAELEATAAGTTVAGMHSMRIALAADLVRPLRAWLVEGPRDRTTIEFSDVKLNVPVAEAFMRPPR